MRIAVLTNAYGADAKSGAERIAYVQVELLTRAGHEVRVWQPARTWFHEPAWMRLVRHLADLGPDQRIAHEIIEWKPNVLITHNLTGCGFGTPAAVQKTDVRWIHILHDVQLFEPSGRLREESVTAWQRVWSFLRGKAMGKPDLVASPTHWLLNEHAKRGFFSDAKTAVLPNPGPLTTFALRMPRVPLELLFVGQVTREKGADLLVRLSKQMKGEARLTVIGSGSAVGLFSSFSGDAVRVLGPRPPAEVLDAMREADILLVPSQIAENQPTVILEAASVGLPVIASDVGGIRETLQGAGICVPPDDLEAWLAAIRSLATPDDYREAAAAMYDIAKRYDPDAYRDRLLQLFASNR